MNNKESIIELENQIAELKNQIELLKLSEKADEPGDSAEATRREPEIPQISTDNPLYIIAVDLNDIITDINYTSGGFSKSDIIGQHALSFVHADYQSLVKSAHLKAKQEGIQVSYESNSIGLDNISRYFITHINPLINHDEVAGLTLITKDITESKIILESLKASEEKLRKSEHEFRTTLDNLLVGVVVHNHDTHILFNNQEASNILGLSTEQMLGKVAIDPVWKFVYEDSTPMKLEDYPVNKVITSRNLITNYECGIIRPDRDYTTWVTVNAMPFFNTEDGKLEKVVVNFIDITEQKQSVQALIKNQRMGAIGEMASSIAHDFNNSLQAIYGNIELALTDDNLSEQTQNYFKIIKNVVNDVAGRVRVLQRFGGDNQSKNKHTRASINSLIDEVILQTRPIWKNDSEKSGITINVNTSYRELPDILCNAPEIRTAFYNIIKNSIEAMPDGGDIAIDSSKTSENIFIAFSDTGVGMNQETRARIFQPFYSTKGFEIGRGMGMSGVYGIIKAHNWDIYVKKTDVGKGTIIEISIPLIKEKDSQPEIKITNTDKSIPKSLNVLWVEDDFIISLNASKMLKKLGHAVDTAGSGAEAIGYLEKKAYDIVITDIGMPEMNGWQLAGLIKEKYNGKMMVAVVSGWGSEIDEAQMEKHGVMRVISKPFHFDEITDLLQTVEKNTSDE